MIGVLSSATRGKSITCVAEEDAMAEFPGCLLIVTAEVDPAVEAEWNRWYDTIHLPDALKCPGVRRGRGYVSSG